VGNVKIELSGIQTAFAIFSFLQKKLFAVCEVAYSYIFQWVAFVASDPASLLFCIFAKRWVFPFF